MSRTASLNLFVAFAFTVMADPVSSVAYAIEAALRGVDGDLGDLFPTMAIVIGMIAVIAASYDQLIRRFPRGGGGAISLAKAFGEGWAFIAIGALLVDFTLTIAISSAASASALIAYVPSIAGARVPLAVGLAALVAGLICLGQRGRVVFATAALAFLGMALVVIALGLGADPVAAGSGAGGSHPFFSSAAVIPVLLAVPLGMALATGVEAPSDAIAQLGELRDRGRRKVGRLTLMLMVAIVGGLTLGIAGLAVHLGIGLPPEDSTLLAEVARAATGGGAAFAIFQVLSALLLLAAAASSYLAASGLLKALTLGGANGLVPRRFGIVNRVWVPYWGVFAVMAAAALLILLAAGRDQEIVHFYAVAVFAAFLGALSACARLSWLDRRRLDLAINVAGLVVVAFVLAVNLTRIDALIALAASAGVSVYLWRVWVARGRPEGISTVASE